MSIIKSQMGKDMIELNGYIFRKNTPSKSTQNWRCTFPKCNATLVSNLNYLESLDLRERNPHGHPPNPTKILQFDAFRRLDEAARNSDASPRTIIAKLRQSLDAETVAMLPDTPALCKRIHRKRRETGTRSSIVPVEVKEEHQDSISEGIASPEKSVPDHVGPLACSFCGEHFSRRHFLLKHEQVNHWGQGKRCRKCNRGFRSGYILQHMKQCKGRPHRCLACGENFHSARSLSRHKIVSHPYKKQSSPSKLASASVQESDLTQPGDSEVRLESLNIASPRLNNGLPYSSGGDYSSQLPSETRVAVPCLIPFTELNTRMHERSGNPNASHNFEDLTGGNNGQFQAHGDIPSPQTVQCRYPDSDEIPPELGNQMAEDVFTVFRKNWKSIRTQTILGYETMDCYNVRLTNSPIDEVKELVKASLPWRGSAFKINLAFGYLVRDYASGRVCYVPASVNAKAVFDQPQMISDPDGLERFLASIVLILIEEKTCKRWPNSDTIVEAVTNLQIHVYDPHNSLDSERFLEPKRVTDVPDSTTSIEKPLFSDVTSIFRCIAQKLGCQPEHLGSRTGEIYWKYASSVGEHLPNGVLLKDFEGLEELFGLQITVFQSDANGRLKMLRRGKSIGDTLHLHLVGNCYNYIPDASE